MLATNTHYRRSRFTGSSSPATASGSSVTYLALSKFPLRTYYKPKQFGIFTHYDSYPAFGRTRRMKTRKINGFSKMDTIRKKTSDYTEMAYREAVSKLKYLLAESYSPRVLSMRTYQDSNLRINESGDDTDDRSVASENYKGKNLITLKSKYYLSQPKNIQLKKTCSKSFMSSGENQVAPPELTSYIERQEEYIQQLERESQYCRDELVNLLGKVREVIAENEVLHDKNKNSFVKSIIDDYESSNAEEESRKLEVKNPSQERKVKRVQAQRALEGPSIVFESRISELEAQLTQAKIELKKCQEENQMNLQRLSEDCTKIEPEMKIQLEQVLRDKRETERKLDELQRDFGSLREREAEVTLKAKRAMDAAREAEFERTRAQEEVRRLMDELDRRNEKLREACQEANRRVIEEKQQVERRYSQQVEQLSADVASQWEVANKSQLESEKQRRLIAELKRDVALKQATIDDLRKELQNKISTLQSDLNRVLSEKDTAEQEITSAKSLAERIERNARQEQNRLQTEISSYKQRLERADADLVHCRRENLRLSEQIGSLEKEINLNKMTEEARTSLTATPKSGNEKEIASMIIDMESKHAAKVAGLEDALSNQATFVSRLTAECQSLTKRLEDNDFKHKQEMASLQNNIKSLSNQIQKTLENQKDYSSENEQNQMRLDENSQRSHEQELPQEMEISNENVDLKDQPMESDAKRQNGQIKNNTEGSEMKDNYQDQNMEEQNMQQQYLEDSSKYDENFGNQDYREYDQYDPSQYHQYYQEGQYNEQRAFDESQYNEQEYINYPQGEKEYTESQSNEQT